MFGRRKKIKLTRRELLQVKAAHAAGQVGPLVARAAEKAAGVTVATVGPQVGKARDYAAPRVEKARDYAAPRVSALAATAAVAVGPRLEKARTRSGAALDALRGAEPVVIETKRRRWPLTLGALLLGLVAGVASRALAKPPATARPAAPVVVAPIPTVSPAEADVVVLDDVRATDETTTTMPTRED